MASVIEGAALAEALGEAKAFLRRDGLGDDEMIARLIGSAAALCEAFTGRWLLVREAQEHVARSSAWMRLVATPVRSIDGVDLIGADGSIAALDEGAFAIDIDANGDGWVRVGGAGEGRLSVRFTAGMAEGWEALPEPLRQGVIRLAAHLYTERESGAEPPAAVSALWRPWRRLRLR